MQATSICAVCCHPNTHLLAMLELSTPPGGRSRILRAHSDQRSLFPWKALHGRVCEIRLQRQVGRVAIARKGEGSDCGEQNVSENLSLKGPCPRKLILRILQRSVFRNEDAYP